MTKYIVRRLVQAVPTFFGITLLSYMLMLGAPGGPVALLTFNPRMTPQDREAYAAKLGVNDPAPVQYIRWLLGDDWTRFSAGTDSSATSANSPVGPRKGILRGDLGVSFFQNRPVLDIITERIPATLELGIAALLLTLLIGVPIGILAAVSRGKWFDNITRVFAVLFNAVPAFWLGLILILILGSMLGILPMGSQCKATLSGG